MEAGVAGLGEGGGSERRWVNRGEEIWVDGACAVGLEGEGERDEERGGKGRRGNVYTPTHPLPHPPTHTTHTHMRGKGDLEENVAEDLHERVDPAATAYIYRERERERGREEGGEGEEERGGEGGRGRGRDRDREEWREGGGRREGEREGEAEAETETEREREG